MLIVYMSFVTVWLLILYGNTLNLVTIIFNNYIYLHHNIKHILADNIYILCNFN